MTDVNGTTWTTPSLSLQDQPLNIDSDDMTDLGRVIAPSARPSADGQTDQGSSEASSWEKVGMPGQSPGAEDEASNNLTNDPSVDQSRADVASTAMPSAAQVMSLSHIKEMMDPELVADVNKLKEEVEDLKMNHDVVTTLQAMHSQLELASTLENERQQKMEEMAQNSKIWKTSMVIIL